MSKRASHIFKTVTTLCAGIIAAAGLASASAQPSFYSGLDVLPSESRTRCEGLAQLDLERVGDAPGRVTSARLVLGRATTPPERIMFTKRGHSQGAPTEPADIYPDHCRVEGYVAPHVRFMMMLPVNGEAWNHRFMLASCDAFCGQISDEIVVPGLTRGYATMTNDGGHTGRAPFDPIWAYDNRSAEIDFGYRANHVSAQIGKAIVEAYFGEAPRYSYATGFSRGGNAGLMSAQRYPEDFDGIFVKAPVVEYQAINTAHFQWVALAGHPDGRNPVMDSTKIPLIETAAMAACDSEDGLTDGIIDDPRVCHFDPVVLLCQADQPETECLTAPQVEAVRRLYSIPVDSRGRPTYPDPQEIGSEADWPRFVVPEPAQGNPAYALWAGSGYLRYLAFDRDPGPNYDWTTFDYTRERRRLEAMSRIYDPNNPDLRRFRAAGGRMIVVHGWGDGAVSARMTIRYWERMTEFMGGRRAVSEFAQLYVVPGMKHGAGGVGPFEYDALTALERWVEQDVAPEHLIMRDPANSGQQRTRPAFPYPIRARYIGAGSTDQAENFQPFDPTAH